MGSAFEEHDWMPDLYHRSPTYDDMLGRSLWHSLAPSGITSSASMGNDGSDVSHGGTQYLPVRDNEPTVMSALNFGQIHNMAASAASAALYQDTSPLATTSNLAPKHTKAYDHSRKRPQMQK